MKVKVTRIQVRVHPYSRPICSLRFAPDDSVSELGSETVRTV
jgi:hypothetical protein